MADARALASPDLVIVLVGNKLDDEDNREVEYLEAARWAKENGRFSRSEAVDRDDTCSLADRVSVCCVCRPFPIDLLFVEVSALTQENITQPFYLLSRAILLAIESGRIDPERSNTGVSYGERSLRRMSSFGGGSSSSIRLGPLRARRLGKGCC